MGQDGEDTNTTRLDLSIADENGIWVVTLDGAFVSADDGGMAADVTVDVVKAVMAAMNAGETDWFASITLDVMDRLVGYRAYSMEKDLDRIRTVETGLWTSLQFGYGDLINVMVAGSPNTKGVTDEPNQILDNEGDFMVSAITNPINGLSVSATYVLKGDANDSGNNHGTDEFANGIIGGTTMKNHGYDLIVNVIPVQSGDFTWQLSVNTSVSKNSVETEKVNTLDDYTSGSCLLEGRPFSTFYSYIFTGLDEEYGQPLFKNMAQYGNSIDFDMANAQLVESITDIMMESGKLTPDFSGGFNTMFKWRNVSLYALFAIQWGGHGRLPNLYEANNGADGLPKPEQNTSRRLNDRWKQPGDETDIPSLPGTGLDDVYIPGVKNPELPYIRGGNRYDLYNLSNARVANTDFIRCRQLSLSYDFKGDWMSRVGLSYLQLKASMTNPFMWVSDKKWDGLDPETGDWPTRRVTSVSLQVMF